LRLKREFICNPLLWAQNDVTVVFPKRERDAMKKLMTLMLGMALAFGTVAVTFAQDAPKKEEGKKKKGKKKKEEPPKNLR
jgi:hypothetical protein